MIGRQHTPIGHCQVSWFTAYVPISCKIVRVAFPAITEHRRIAVLKLVRHLQRLTGIIPTLEYYCVCCKSGLNTKHRLTNFSKYSTSSDPCQQSYANSSERRVLYRKMWLTLSAILYCNQCMPPVTNHIVLYQCMTWG